MSNVANLLACEDCLTYYDLVYELRSNFDYNAYNANVAIYGLKIEIGLILKIHYYNDTNLFSFAYTCGVSMVNAKDDYNYVVHVLCLDG